MTAPSIVSKESMRKWLGLSTHDDDSILCGIIEAAQTFLENRTGKDFADYYDEATAVSTVPAPIVLAIKQLAAHWFENREVVLVGDRMTALPMSVDELIAPYCEVVI
jgi:hypothetical protein